MCLARSSGAQPAKSHFCAKAAWRTSYWRTELAVARVIATSTPTKSAKNVQ